MGKDAKAILRLTVRDGYGVEVTTGVPAILGINVTVGVIVYDGVGVSVGSNDLDILIVGVIVGVAVKDDSTEILTVLVGVILGVEEGVGLGVITIPVIAL